VAGDEEVTSPDQHRRTNLKVARVGGVLTIIILLLMTIGNHEGNIEDIWLVGLAALLAAIMIADWLMRRNGLRS